MLVAALAGGAGSAVAHASAAGRCAEQRTLVGPCFTVHGRLSQWNGAPSARIWKIGTHRMLGVSDSRCQEPECLRMPERLRRLLDWDHAIFGDFVVCPFTMERAGHMQMICIEAASKLVVRPLP